MLYERLMAENPELMSILKAEKKNKLYDNDLCNLSIELNLLLSKINPKNPKYLCNIGEAYHLQRNLGKAGEYYKRALELDKPENLNSEEKEIIFKYAPIIKAQEGEFFKLMDVVAVHHPTEPMIAYHFFWEDDFNFPDDYDPCDHEQIWVRYDRTTKLVTNVWTFFHSNIITSYEAVEEANCNNGHVIVRCEWGIHGTLLMGWENQKFVNNNEEVFSHVERNYNYLVSGGRAKDHPIKKRWPEKFVGSFKDYINFNKEIDTRELLMNKGLYIKSAWCNAVIQQYMLAYNFAPKFDWPL